MGVGLVKALQCGLQPRRGRVQHHQVHAVVAMGGTGIGHAGTHGLHHRGLFLGIQRILGEQCGQAKRSGHRAAQPLHPQVCNKFKIGQYRAVHGISLGSQAPTLHHTGGAGALQRPCMPPVLVPCCAWQQVCARN